MVFNSSSSFQRIDLQVTDKTNVRNHTNNIRQTTIMFNYVVYIQVSQKVRGDNTQNCLMNIQEIRVRFVGDAKVGVKSQKMRGLKQWEGGKRLFRMRKIA